MTARARGKSFERTVADLFGGRRQPPTGAAGPDVVCPGLVVECKRVDEAGIRGAWIRQAREHGRRSGLPWALVKAEKGSPVSVTVLDTTLAVELLRNAGLLDTASKRGADGA